MSTFVCSLSGKPTNDPVITPSGHIYSKHLLLEKLSENGGKDPINGTELTEDNLTVIHVSSKVVAPKLVAGDFQNLIQTLQKEYDATLLELFDTRQLLEETRRELSQALYQNDAAVRVVSRLVMERDAAREQLARYATSGPNATLQQEQPPAEVVEDSMDVDDAVTSKMPEPELNLLLEISQKLSKGRKKRSVGEYATFEEISGYTTKNSSLNVHKSNKSTSLFISSISDNLVVSGGEDRTLIIFDTAQKTVIQTIADIKSSITSLHSAFNMIVVGMSNGGVRLYALVENNEYEFIGEENVDGSSPVVGVALHPTKQHFLATSASKKILFCKIDVSHKSVQKKAVIVDETGEGGVYTSSTLHPDGLLFLAGTDDGRIKLWDLRTQKLIESPDLTGHTGSVIGLTISENGYTAASASSTGEVFVWDLRKSKISKKLNEDKGLSSVHCLEFHNSAKYLAYAGDEGLVVTVVKSWDKCTKFESDKLCKSFIWGASAKSLISGGDRGLKIWSSSHSE